MAKKQAKIKVVEHRCGECAHGTWVTDFKHLDTTPEHKPICLKCEFERYFVVRSQAACERFEKRNK